MKAVLLARVSTEEQKEAGNSLPAQIVRGKEYCKRKGFTVVKEESFDESAYKTKRDTFDEILEYIKCCKEKVAVCFDKVDRFSRNIFDKRVAILYELAMQDKIELHFVSDNLVINSSISATEKFHFNINLGLAKYYSDAISDNTRRALEQKLRRGEWIGQARIGYLDDFTPDPQRAPLIRKMFELYATGNYSVKTLKAEIDSLGLKSKNNKELSNSMVHKILKDRFYTGVMTSKGVEFPHKYQTIISDSLFDKVQAVLTGYQKKSFKYASKPFAFRGLIKCEECGCTITPEMKTKKSGRVYIYYSCSNFKGKCTRIFVKEAELLTPVKEMLSKMKLPEDRVERIVKDLKALSGDKGRFHRQALEGLQREYNELQKKIERILELLIDTSITKEDYDKKLKDYKEQQYAINQKMQTYTNADEKYHITAATVFSLANRALEIFESSEANEKRQLLNFLLQNCRLSGKNLLFEVRSPFNTILETAHQPIGLRR